ncbi:zinc-ribbon domain-containing protein [Flavobacterium sp. ZS1P14]|uniref:zinc-ribbon domain-containing protein n=1 Tax=Flavobacterium sp. ZS1P14 TaxID=3401729 RepID=UPI003AAD67EB
MIIFGTKTIPSVIKTGEFNCPNCQNKQNYTLKRFKKHFHIFFIPLIPTDNLGDGLECDYCLICTRHSTF